MKRMTREQYIEKLDEYIREMPDINDYDLEGLCKKAGFYFNPNENRADILNGIEVGLQIAIDLLTDL